MFQINEVVEFDGELFRILAAYPEEVVWLPVLKDGVFPAIVTVDTLSVAIESGLLARKADPFEYLAYEIAKEGTTNKKKIEQNFQLIKPIIYDDQCFLPKVRSARIAKVIEEYSTTKQTVYRLLRRYWQRGQTVNALLPDYKNSGGKGKSRNAKDKKLGRPRINKPGIGAVIDANIARLFRIAIEKHMLTDKGNSLQYAHRQFTAIYETYYPQIPEEEKPSFWQLEHFYKREYHQVETIKKRSSKIEYQKDIRPLFGTVNTSVLGPGSRFEIDATIADIYLVSNSERQNIVGRPVVYMVIDVFSRMVAGVYVGMENPSYATAMLALINALTNKVNFCKAYGLEISFEDWPVAGLPDAILADRGELIGHQIESLERTFSVRIENTPPYRGDAKGVVERYFRTVQAVFKPHAPGVVTETIIRKRGGKDYRLDAKLTIDAFTGIILNAVLFHNRHHTLEDYDRDIDMPTDLPMTPLSLWNWGLQNRTGKLRSASVDAITVALLPRIKATLSELGISVFGVFYTCREIVEKGWLHRSKEISRPQNLKAAYDPRSADHIYLFPNSNSSEYWLCTLTQKSREFSGCSFWDVWQIKSEQKKALARNDLVSKARHRELDQKIEQIIKRAENEMPDTRSIPNAQRIKGIDKNRIQAKQDERKKKVIDPVKNHPDQLADVISIKKGDREDDYVFPSHIDELFDGDE
ncbi:MAG: transposase [Methylococcales bacterium]